MLMTNSESEQEQSEQQDKELSGPGQQLACARQAHQMTQEEVAQKLCLSLQLVRDIERDEYKQKINAVFLRGYLRSYARLVGLLPDQVVRAFDGLYLQETQKVPTSTSQAQVTVLCDAKVKLPGKKIKWASYLMCLILILLAIVWWHDYAKMQKKAVAFTSENSSLSSSSNTEQSQPIDIQNQNNSSGEFRSSGIERE